MNIFFELIQLSLGKRDSFCLYPNEREWGELFEFAKKQALVGVLFSGIERLPETQRPPKDILLKWFALVQKIEERNRVLNRQVVAVSERFMRDGFCSCILKGQGNAALYPNPQRRQSGDIDIWLDGGRKRIMKYVSSKCSLGEVRYHHVDFPVLKDVCIEVHFTPSYLHDPFCNRRLQLWFMNEAVRQFDNNIVIKNVGEFNVPTLTFNIVYQLTHIYNHLFDEGIGLRQMMDYYFLLLSAKDNSNYELRIRNYELASLVRGSSEVQKSDFKFLSSLVLKFLSCQPENLITSKPNNLTKGIKNDEEDSRLPMMNGEGIELLKSLKLYKFAGAVMWVLGEVFGLERELMYVEPNEKEGRFLLDEIMMAGNFGHYDPRFGDLENESRGHKFVRKLKRNLRFVKSYPNEVIWEPVFRVWHFLWRKLVVRSRLI